MRLRWGSPAIKSALCSQFLGSVNNPGWLAYDWNNLLFSCTACNTKKRELVPLIDNKARACSHHDDITMEQPLLIDLHR
jgi:hypothetical protein